MATKKKMTDKQKREARNKYSHEWKKKHKKQVTQWNREWRKAKAKNSRGHKPKKYRGKAKKAA